VINAKKESVPIVETLLKINYLRAETPEVLIK
jgi:hypothetical protein